MSVTTTVSLSFDAKRLRATKTYMGKKDADLEAEMSSQLQRLYEKYVPSSVREYIDEDDEQVKVKLPVGKRLGE